MSANEIFKATMPFVWVKLGMKMLYIFLRVFIIASIIWGFISGAERIDTTGGSVTFYGLQNFNFMIMPLILLFVVMPILSLILRNYGRFLVRVGHIAVLTEVAKTGYVPPNQVAWGMNQVREHFGRATVFFFINRMICSAIHDLQFVMRNALAGLGPVSFIVNAFKQTFLKYIDECCLAYTFTCEGTGPFLGAVKGIVIYVFGWKNMAMAAAKTVLYTFLISLAFRILAILLIIAGVMSMNLPLLIFSLFFFSIIGALKQCFLDSYAMVMMLVAFLDEAERTDIDVAAVQKVASMSRRFRELVFQANREEHFLDDEEENKILQSGGFDRNFF